MHEYQEDANLGYVAPTTNSVYKVYGASSPLEDFDEGDFDVYGTKVLTYNPAGKFMGEFRALELDTICHNLLIVSQWV